MARESGRLRSLRGFFLFELFFFVTLGTIVERLREHAVVTGVNHHPANFFDLLSAGIALHGFL